MPTTNKSVMVLSPRGAHDLLGRLVLKDGPSFGLVGLTANGEVIGHRVISIGDLDHEQAAPREFYREALRLGPSLSVVLAYEVVGAGRRDTVAKAAKALVDRMRASGDVLGVPLADYLILDDEWMISFRAREGWDQGPPPKPLAG